MEGPNSSSETGTDSIAENCSVSEEEEEDEEKEE
jgi:hypothetical protein